MVEGDFDRLTRIFSNLLTSAAKYARCACTSDDVGCPYRMGQRQEHQRTREAGFDWHLLKPIDPNEVDKVLGRVAGYA